MERDTKRFIDFLCRAKKETYAAQGDDASVSPLLEGSRQLEYREGDFLYRDIYFGMSYFIGQETVYFKGEPLWSMAYSGGVPEQHDNDTVREIYAFLRKAMSEVTPSNPYRGPSHFVEGKYQFIDANQGSIEQFTGNEKILLDNEEIYSLHYSGGFVR